MVSRSQEDGPIQTSTLRLTSRKTRADSALPPAIRKKTPADMVCQVGRRLRRSRGAWRVRGGRGRVRPSSSWVGSLEATSPGTSALLCEKCGEGPRALQLLAVE